MRDLDVHNSDDYLLFIKFADVPSSLEKRLLSSFSQSDETFVVLYGAITFGIIAR